MAKNELVSLALIYYAPMHAYAINSFVKEMGLEHWAYISPASIYNSLARLEKLECVDVATEKVGNMPERKVYSITSKGKSRFLEELKEAIMSENMGDYPFYLAVSFAYGIPPEEALPILQDRIDNLEKVLEHITSEYEELKAQKVFSGMIITKAGMKHVQIEIEAAKEFVELLKTNPEYYTRDLKSMMCEESQCKDPSNSDE